MEQPYFHSFQKGEEQGFNYFFYEYYKLLLHFAHSLVNNKENAEEIVEDSFVNLWKKRESISTASAIKPYLYTSVRNGCLNFLQRQVEPRKKFEVQIKRIPIEFEMDVSRKLIASETMHQIYLAVQSLPPKCREIFTKIYVEGKEVREIASELGISISTVKTQKLRAIELIREQLPHLGSLLILFLHL